MSAEKLGEILLRMGALDDLRLKTALGEQKRWGGTLGNTLLRLQYCSTAQVLKALGEQAQAPAVDLDSATPEVEALESLGRRSAERHHVLPLRLEGPRHEVLVIAMPPPIQLSVLDAVRAASRRQRVIAVVALDEAVDRAISRWYGQNPQADAFVPEDAPAELQPAGAGKEIRPNVYLFGCDAQTVEEGRAILLDTAVAASEATELDVQTSLAHDLVLAHVDRLAALRELLDGTGTALAAHLVALSPNPAQDLERARAAGARGVLALPFEPARLIQLGVRLYEAANAKK